MSKPGKAPTPPEPSPAATRAARATIRRHFGALEDPRVVGRTTHDLMDVLAIALLAMIAGAEGWDDMEAFAQAWEPLLREWLGITTVAMPSDDTFRRVFVAITPQAFAACVHAWLGELSQTVVGKQLAIDGKTLRRSFDRAKKLSPLHLVHAWVVESQTLLGQVATEDKSNEITAVGKILEMFDLRGCVVTMDAMGCQRTHLERIIAAEADYVVTVKENQPKLYAEIDAHFTAKDEGGRVPTVESVDEGHGRVEVRTVSVSAELRSLPIARGWPGLKSVVRVVRHTLVGGVGGTERHGVTYLISSLGAVSKQRIADAVRGHWSVENSLHWTLDMTFREDESRVRDRHAAENLAAVRRIVLSLLKNDTIRKGSLRLKRFRASLDPGYALKVLFNDARIH